MRRSLLLVAPDLFGSNGGIARISRAMTLACSQWAARRDVELSVVVLHDRHDLEADRRYLPVGRYRGFDGRRAPFTAAIIASRLAGATAVFMHVHHAPLGFVRRAPFAVVGHGVELWRDLRKDRLLALRAADAWWPISRYTEGVLVARHGAAPERVHTLHNCLDPFWQPSDASEARPKFALAVSRLSEGEQPKGIDRTIEALARVRDRLPEGFSFQVIGQGPDRERLEAIANRLGVGDRVRFLGGVDDERLRRAYAECSFFILPSRKEGFGLVYLEAMASRRAVIAARAGGSPEVVADGETGVLVDPDDVAGLGEAIATLANDDERRRTLGAAGLTRLDTHFSFPRYADAVNAALDRLHQH